MQTFDCIWVESNNIICFIPSAEMVIDETIIGGEAGLRNLPD